MGAVVLLLVLLGVGAFALRGVLTTDKTAPSGSEKSSAQQSHTRTPTPARSSTGAVPTLRLDVTGAKSTVFIRVPGGDVLLDTTLAHGKHAEFSQPELDVVLGDGGAVRVTVNGKVRSSAESGEQLQFTVHGKGDS